MTEQNQNTDREVGQTTNVDELEAGYGIGLVLLQQSVKHKRAGRAVPLPPACRMAWTFGYSQGVQRYEEHSEVYNINRDDRALLLAGLVRSAKDTPELRELAELCGRHTGGVDAVALKAAETRTEEEESEVAAAVHSGLNGHDIAGNDDGEDSGLLLPQRGGLILPPGHS